MISIYRSEVLDGLSEKIQNSGSIAYCTQINKAKNPERVIKSLASKRNNQPDLYAFEGILVSTGWNQNRDVFDRTEVWLAKDTPEDKPLNFEHQETDIIGHITKSWAVDLDNNELADSLTVEDVIKSDYHIANASVLYKVWQDPKNIERIEKIIAEIEENLWFLSMECIFSNFDYALRKDGQNKVIARNEQTSFLTKHLRQYGGTGSYNDHEIGRVLRNIVFCGKGLVRQPANPNSVIFSNLSSFANVCKINISDLNKNSVYINSKSKIVQEKNMSESVESMAKLVDDLKASVDKLTTERDGLKKSLSEIDVKAAEAKISSLDTVIKNKEVELKTLTDKFNEASAKITDLENKLKESDEKVVAANKSLDDIKKAQLVATRSALLKDKGVPADKIEKTVQSFVNLTDEQFALIVGMVEKTAPKDDKKDSDSVTTKGSLDDVKSDDDISLAVGGSDDSNVVADDIAKYFNKKAKE